jgi:hypothetical protein
MRVTMAVGSYDGQQGTTSTKQDPMVFVSIVSSCPWCDAAGVL